MGYRIELSINLRHTGNITYEKERIIDYAEKNNYEMCFENIEISGRRKVVYKNISVITLLFPEDEKYIINFIKKIKCIKTITIETVSYDNCIFRLLYSRKQKKLDLKNLSSQDKAVALCLK